jgi:hypothetical protein
MAEFCLECLNKLNGDEVKEGTPSPTDISMFMLKLFTLILYSPLPGKGAGVVS